MLIFFCCEDICTSSFLGCLLYCKGSDKSIKTLKHTGILQIGWLYASIKILQKRTLFLYGRFLYHFTKLFLTLQTSELVQVANYYKYLHLSWPSALCKKTIMRKYRLSFLFFVILAFQEDKITEIGCVMAEIWPFRVLHLYGL